MTRIAYVNGRYLRHADAGVHIEDRGYQFADSVYEVCEVRHGYIVDLTRHLDRLDRSLRELRIAWPVKRTAMIQIIRETLRRNHVENGLFYAQITRGAARRDHVFPTPETKSTLVVTAKKTDPSVVARKNTSGIKAITLRDNRWDRVDIKTTGLLPNTLARQAAKEAGAQEAIFVDAEGRVTEGAATNIWMVDAHGTLITPPADKGILKGITRTTLMDVAQKIGVVIVERPFMVAEMKSAQEVFVTAATSICFPVVSIDNMPIANGRPGAISGKIREHFFDVAEKTAI